jgi:outer membrane lipoprotein carrier protein
VKRPAGASIRRAAALIVILGAGAFRSGDASDIVEKMEKKYGSIHDASLTFTRHVVFGVTRSEQDFSGSLRMKKGNKYRIELEDQTIVTDGVSAWTYSRINNQVFIDAYREDSLSFSPDRILVNVPENYSATLLGEEKVGTRETSILKLVPKNERSNLKWMKLWVDRDDWLMRRIQLLDVADNQTTYEVGDITLNAGISDTTFQFHPPPGVEVIDVR